jgi:hypothetical protein
MAVTTKPSAVSEIYWCLTRMNCIQNVITSTLPSLRLRPVIYLSHNHRPQSIVIWYLNWTFTTAKRRTEKAFVVIIKHWFVVTHYKCDVLWNSSCWYHETWSPNLLLLDFFLYCLQHESIVFIFVGAGTYVTNVFFRHVRVLRDCWESSQLLNLLVKQARMKITFVCACNDFHGKLELRVGCARRQTFSMEYPVNILPS